MFTTYKYKIVYNIVAWASIFTYVGMWYLIFWQEFRQTFSDKFLTLKVYNILLDLKLLF